MNKIYVMGDIHQSFKPVRQLYQTLNLNTDSSFYPSSSDTLILLGDTGTNFFGNYLDRNFKQKLGRYNFTYFIIRGNHDKRPEDCAKEFPDNWHTEKYFGNSVLVENEYPYIKYASDIPALYNIKGHLTLVVPGAYSVDKFYRINNKLGWFYNEQLDEIEKQAGRNLIERYPYVDLVLTHTCPKIYQPTDLFLSVIDQSSVDDSMEKYLGEIEINLDYKLWLFGHYHHLRIYPKYEEKQMIMLTNTEVIDLDKYFETKNSYDALIKIKEV